MRTVYTGDHYDAIAEDEQFQDAEIVQHALDLIEANKGTATAIISAEWERKGQAQRGPVTDTNSYRTGHDELIISVEIRIPAWNRVSFEEVALFEQEVVEAINDRETERAHAMLAQLEAEQATLDAQREALTGRINGLRASL